MLDVIRYQWFTKESIRDCDFEQHPHIGEVVFDQLYKSRDEAVDHLQEHDEMLDATFVAAEEGWELVTIQYSLRK